MTKELIQVAEIDIIYRPKIKASERPHVKNSQDAVKIFRMFFNDDTIEHHEEFKVMLLNRGNKVLGIKNLSSGGTSGTVVDVVHILQLAIKTNARGIVLCHNHPSGNLSPSQSDIEITKKIKTAAAFHDLSVIDHLIVDSGYRFYSFADEGII